MYKHKQTGQLCELIELNEKFKTVMVKLDNGKTISMTTTTFYKMWVPIEE